MPTSSTVLPTKMFFDQDRVSDLRRVMLHPFLALECVQCGALTSQLRYCERYCLPNRQGLHYEAFTDGTRTGDRLVPHLHRICGDCHYEWLTETKGSSN